MARLRFASLAGLLLFVAGLNTALAQQRFDHDEVIEQRFDVGRNSTLTIDSDLGSMIVEGSKGSEVIVRIVKGMNGGSERDAEEQFDKFTVEFDASSRGVEIIGRYDRPRNWRGWGNRSLQVRYEIEVPSDIDVDLKTAGGSIQVADIDGEALLHTSGGSLVLKNIGGIVDARTSGGSIEANGLGERSKLRTSGGSIKVANAGGPVDCQTSGGSITVERADGDVDCQTSGGSIRMMEIAGAVNATTSGGSIVAEIIGQPAQDMNLRTSGGSVTLRMDDNVRATLDAQSSGGSVKSDLAVSVRGEIKRDKLQGEINGGGPLLTLRSSGGGVRIVEN
ncbi:MAG: hypothetical protein R2834_18210 [Rhodothermales bacterium]